jgi:hypothetical protein
MIKPYTIVGVLADQVDKTVGGTIEPFILVPQEQIPTTSLFYQGLLKTIVSFVVKTRGNIPVAAEMRSVFHQAAPGIALDNFKTMQDLVEQNTFSQRLGLYLVGSFAGLAVLMVIAGLYESCRSWWATAAGKSASGWRWEQAGRAWRRWCCGRDRF